VNIGTHSQQTQADGLEVAEHARDFLRLALGAPLSAQPRTQPISVGFLKRKQAQSPQGRDYNLRSISGFNPVNVPPMIRSRGSKIKHAFNVGLRPPTARDFQAAFYDMAGLFQ